MEQVIAVWGRVRDYISSVPVQTDPFGLIIGVLTFFVSLYVALILHRLSRRFQENEATRAINTSWDSFHNAMLDREVHDLFWNFVSSDEPVTKLGERAHHIVLMYVNNIHTEYYTYKAQIYRDYELAYLDRLLEVFVDRRDAVVTLARISGYDTAFLEFMDQRLRKLAARPRTVGAGV